MLKNRKVYLSVIFIISFALLLSQGVYALVDSYTKAYEPEFTTLCSWGIHAYSPFRSSSDVYENSWNDITSTHNKPRKKSGSLSGVSHNAIDIKGDDGTPVYSIGLGKVIDVYDTSQSYSCVIVEYTSSYEPLVQTMGQTCRVRYMHLESTEIEVEENDIVSASTLIGKTHGHDDGDHVDLQLSTETNSGLESRGQGVSRTWNSVYAGVYEWYNEVYGIDYIKDPTFTKVGNDYQVSVSISTVRSQNPAYPGSVYFYYKKQGNNTWYSQQMSGPGAMNYCTLQNASAGDTIQYYIYAYDSAEGWSLYPSYYYNPPSESPDYYGAPSEYTNPHQPETFTQYLP